MNTLPVPEKPTSPSSDHKKWIPLLILFILLLGIFLYSKSKKSQLLVSTVLNTINPSPTPFPFEEYTIPYLRNRTYNSSLGDLEPLNTYGNYTSYLTNYQSDGLKINGLLTKPTGDPPVGGWPAIVFVHGYIAPSQYQTTERYVDYVDYLARNGFVVFKIDLRGHGESEGEPSGAYFSGDYIIDTLNAYSTLEHADFVNPKAIGLWGHSMAGNVVMRSLAVKPTIPAVVIWAGAVYSYLDRQKYGIHDNSYRPNPSITQQQGSRQRLNRLYGEYATDSAFWKAMAPTNFLTDLKGAIEINHAVDDDVVNIGYSRDLMALLDKTSVPHELHEYPTGGHNITGASFVAAMENTVEFFKKYLEKEM